jgi:hypothetical protein
MTATSIRISDQSEGSCIPGAEHPVAVTFRNGRNFQEMVSGLVPEPYDEITLSYTGSDLTGVVYKSASTSVATLTLEYSGSNLTKVTRS